jgi:hypothetical protein
LNRLRKRQHRCANVNPETRGPRGRRRVALASITSVVAFALLTVPSRPVYAQAPGDSSSSQWRAWAFGRLGPAETSLSDSHGRRKAIFGSAAGGVAASYGPIVGMLRATDNENTTFVDNPPPGEQDYAVLVGLRSRGDRLFVAGAAGLARSVRTDFTNTFGQFVSDPRLAPAFDLSGHADYAVVGLSLTVSGVLGPPPVRYLAVSLGAELGWFGSR